MLLFLVCRIESAQAEQPSSVVAPLSSRKVSKHTILSSIHLYLQWLPCSGAGTTLLHSSFESWLVAEHSEVRRAALSDYHRPHEQLEPLARS